MPLFLGAAFILMGTGIDTSTAAASGRVPGGALVRRATVRLSVTRMGVRPLGWLRREARRLLADDPQATAIRRAVLWASVAGATLGVILAFLAAEPEDAGHAKAAWRSGPSLALARRPPARRPPRRPPLDANGERTRAAPLPVVTAPPSTPARVGDSPTGTAPAPEPVAAVQPPVQSPPPREAPAGAQARPVPGADGVSQLPVAPPATPRVAGAERGSPTKGRRREGPGTPALLPKAGADGASGAQRGDADELAWLAERAFQAGHAAEAVRLGQKALAAGAGARAQLTIAGAYFDMREFDRARGAYEAVLAEEPGNQAARTGLDISRSALAGSVARAP